MKKIYTCIVVGVTTLMLMMSSCSGFLDQDSKQHIEKEDAEEFGPDVLLNGAYGIFTDWDYGFSYLGVTSIISDNADKGSSVSDDGGDKKDIDDLKHNTSSGSFGSMWKNWYNTIGRATRAIEAAEEYEKPIDEAYRARLIGEAKFLRAVSYFFLVRGWGDVPIQERGAEFLDERVPVAEVYAHIEKDLKEAMEVLPIKYGASDTGRATKGAAHGLLAKVYLYQKKYQEAYDAAKIVADQSVYGYKLVPDYAIIWRVEGENSTESLFEIQARGSAIAHGIQQYSASQAPRGGAHELGWGFNVPSQNLLDAYNAEGDVVRRDATIIFRGTPLYDGQLTSGTENPMYNYKAYSSANKGAANTDKNLRYLRLGEIVLIKAEAANELGNTSDATTALNQVRTRVNLAGTTATSQADLRKAIWNERRLELAFEHDRWFDLVRTGQAKTAMAADGKVFVEGKHELFPISDQQMIDSNYEMSQNPGWN